jgi:hypothetical protein
MQTLSISTAISCTHNGDNYFAFLLNSMWPYLFYPLKCSVHMYSKWLLCQTLLQSLHCCKSFKVWCEYCGKSDRMELFISSKSGHCLSSKCILFITVDYISLFKPLNHGKFLTNYALLSRIYQKIYCTQINRKWVWS